MYTHAVADSVVLYLQRDFYNIIFKMKHKLFIASGQQSPCKGKIVGAPGMTDSICFSLVYLLSLFLIPS
jgi:hypothetical protein